MPVLPGKLLTASHVPTRASEPEVLGKSARSVHFVLLIGIVWSVLPLEAVTGSTAVEKLVHEAFGLALAAMATSNSSLVEVSMPLPDMVLMFDTELSAIEKACSVGEPPRFERYARTCAMIRSLTG